MMRGSWTVALILATIGDMAIALAELPTTAQQRRVAAIELANQGRWTEALARADEAVTMAPEYADARFVRAGIHLRLAGPQSTLRSLRTPDWRIDYDRLLAHLRAAMSDLDSYLKFDGSALDRSRIRATRERLAARLQAAERAREQAQNLGSLTVDSDSGEAEVHLRDEPVGTTPVELHNLPAGTYALEVRTDRHQWRGTVEVEARQHVRIEPALERIWMKLMVTSTPPGARVLLDGKPAGTTPLLLDRLNPGEHVVVVRRAGYVGWRKAVTLDLDHRSEQLDVALTKRAVVDVSSNPSGAAVLVDGAHRGKTPARIEVDPGEREISIRHDFFQTFTSTQRLAPGAVAELHAKLSLAGDASRRIRRANRAMDVAELGFDGSLGPMGMAGESGVATAMSLLVRLRWLQSRPRSRAIAALAAGERLPPANAWEVGIDGSFYGFARSAGISMFAGGRPVGRWWWRQKLAVGGMFSLGYLKSIRAEGAARAALGINLAASTKPLGESRRTELSLSWLPVGSAPIGGLQARVLIRVKQLFHVSLEAGRTDVDRVGGNYVMIGAGTLGTLPATRR